MKKAGEETGQVDPVLVFEMILNEIRYDTKQDPGNKYDHKTQKIAACLAQGKKWRKQKRSGIGFKSILQKRTKAKDKADDHAFLIAQDQAGQNDWQMQGRGINKA